ncbi:AAA family ATPase [Flindersiella endophytica]
MLPELPAGRPLLMAIDGCSGAGKSTLARVIADGLADATVVHGDDFYAGEPAGWESWEPAEAYSGFWDYRTLERDLLQPLRLGTTATYRPYDWDRNRVGIATVDVRPSRVVIVEGVLTLRPELLGYWDFAIYVDTTPDERRRRILDRNENDEIHIAQWTAGEDYYVETHAPHAFADIVLDGGKSAGTPDYPSFILPG